MTLYEIFMENWQLNLTLIGCSLMGLIAYIGMSIYLKRREKNKCEWCRKNNKLAYANCPFRIDCKV